MSNPLDQRPVIVALAGSNGVGKTTFKTMTCEPRFGESPSYRMGAASV